MIYRALITLMLCALPSTVFGATYGFSPGSGSYAVGKTFTVAVQLNTADQSANAVSALLRFPPDILQVTSISKAGSLVSLWVQEPTFSNINGTISFEGAILNPGYQGSGGRLMSVTFKALGGGFPRVSVASGAILANDGAGTNILTNLTAAQYSITQPSITVTPTTPPTSLPPTMDTVAITSPTHPTPDVWSRSDDAVFQWVLPDDSLTVQYGLDRTPTGLPTGGTAESIGGITIPLTDMTDGTYYFHLRYRQGTTWSSPIHRRILVDRSPPESLEVSEIKSPDVTEPRPVLRVDATDSTSGLDRLVVTWPGGSLEVPASDIRRFRLPLFAPGAHTITVRAFDKAGNSRLADAHVYVAPLTMPRIEYYDAMVGQAWPWSEPVLEPHARGTTEPGDDVVLSFERQDGLTTTTTVRADLAGQWRAPYPNLSSGTWTLRAVARDARGATSFATEPVVLHVGSQVPFFVWIAPWPIAFGLGIALWFALRRRRSVEEGIEVPVRSFPV